MEKRSSDVAGREGEESAWPMQRTYSPGLLAEPLQAASEASELRAVSKARRTASAPCLGAAQQDASRLAQPHEATPLLSPKGSAPAAVAPPAAPVALRSIRPLPPLGEAMRVIPFLCICAMAGVLTRIGMSELFGSSVLGVTSSASQTFPDWFANAWGSLVMGFLSPMRQSSFFAGRSWLYIGLATGYCGCTTTFSSWNQGAAALIVRADGLGQMVTYLLILLDGVAVPLFCFFVGRHLHTFLVQLITATTTKPRKVSVTESGILREGGRNGGGGTAQELNPAVFAGETSEQEVEDMESHEKAQKQASSRTGKLSHEVPKPAAPYWRVTIGDLMYCLTFCLFLLALCLAWFLLIAYGGSNNRYIWISCLFSPFGALVRYVLSRYNTWRRCSRFPLFTFLVNVVGSIGLGLTVISTEMKNYDLETDVPGYALQGFEVGFFGSLTTVSTFIGELYALPAVPYAYIYGFLSITITQVALVLINGLYRWV